MELHKKGNLDEAEEAYRKLIEGNVNDKRIYVNLAAILRSKGKANEAGQIVSKGLQIADPNSPILFNTLGNCLRDLQRYPEAINYYRKALKVQPGYFDAQISVVASLYEGGYKILSDLCLWEMFRFYGYSKKSILNQIITREIEKSNASNRPLHPGLNDLLKSADTLSDEDENKLPLHWYLAAQLCCDMGKIDDAKEFYRRAITETRRKWNIAKETKLREKAKNLYIISSWNFSCQLLKNAEMKMGWELYEHGLNTPCDGPQKWQRALFKPFTYSKVQLWRGQPLTSKNILLLGEQGIGDTMSFISLIQKIVEEANKVSIVVPLRLQRIYERSLPECTILSDKEVRDKPLDEKNFDYQSPLGSIVQYHYKNLDDFKSRYFKLVSDEKNRNILRQKYKRIFNNNKPIIGLSWQGGGKKDRLLDKSIDLSDLAKFLEKYDINFLSLQYGDDEKIVKKIAKMHNIRFIDDPDIQATKNMDLWLDQVDACDGVISIANTTIHGAGGLRKPTICLLGEKSDWRWLKDKKEKFSYWYPTVEISWQDKSQGNWDAALKNIPSWLQRNDLV